MAKLNVGDSKLDDAKRIAKERGYAGIIIIGFTCDQLESVSYGSNVHNCNGMGKMLDSICDKIENSEVYIPVFVD